MLAALRLHVDPYSPREHTWSRLPASESPLSFCSAPTWGRHGWSRPTGCSHLTVRVFTEAWL